MNNEFTRMQKLAGILTEGYQGTDYESSEDMALGMVKTGAGMPGTGLPETKTKMTKSEAKKMIKDAILAEMSHNPDDSPYDEMADPHNLSPYTMSEEDTLEEASTEAIDRMNGLVDRRVISSMLYSVGEIIKSLKEEGFEEDDIHDYLVYLVTTLDDSALMEAKKEKEVEDVETEEIGEETIEEPADDNVDMDMEGDLDLDAGSDEAKDAFDELTDAYRAAKELGDEKLVRQLANTITYFNKNIILK
jgi:hypothetical protein